MYFKKCLKINKKYSLWKIYRFKIYWVKSMKTCSLGDIELCNWSYSFSEAIFDCVAWPSTIVITLDGTKVFWSLIKWAGSSVHVSRALTNDHESAFIDGIAFICTPSVTLISPLLDMCTSVSAETLIFMVEALVVGTGCGDESKKDGEEFHFKLFFKL